MNYPADFQLKELYNNYHDALLTNTTLKLRESNKMKSNLADPHSRAVVIPDIHRLVFTGTFFTEVPANRTTFTGCCRFETFISNI